MLTIWIIPFPVMVFSDFPVLVNEKSNLQIRIGYFAFLPSLDISGNPTKKQGKPKLNPTWIFDFFSSYGFLLFPRFGYYYDSLISSLLSGNPNLDY